MVCLKQPRILIGNLVFALCFSLSVINFQRSFQSKIYPKQTPITGQLQVYADQTKVNGNLVTLEAYCPQIKQKVQAFYQLKNQDQQQWWLENQANLQVDFTGKINGINVPTNENEFDYRRFCETKKIANSIYIQAASPQLEKKPGLVGKLHEVRRRLMLYFARLPQPLGNYAAVLLIGYQPQVFADTLDQIRNLGLLYLFCLSGMHVFYLLLVIKRICRLVKLSQEATNLLTLCIIPIYALLGGASLSLLRASGMVFIANLMKLLGVRPWNSLNSWSLVVLVNLLVNPAVVFSLGAQLSYLLTLMILIAPKLSDIKLGVYLNLLSLPLILWQTYKWNLLTMALTILIIPIFEWLILPSVVLGTMCHWLRPLCNQVLTACSLGFALLKRLPMEVVFGKPPLIIVCFWLGLTLLLLVKPKKRLVICLLLTYGLTFMMIHLPLTSEVVYFDVGQGDATLIRDKFNRTVTLIDTGGKVAFTKEKWQVRQSKTAGQTVISNYLLSKGVGRIDQLVLTHQDSDHVGNFPSLSQVITIKQIFIPAGMEKLPSFQGRVRQARLSQTKIWPVTVGNSATLRQVKLLHPFTAGKGTNECSLVLWYNLKRTSYLFMGDLDRANELVLLAKYPNLTATVLKVGHHGSKTSSDPRFIGKIKPQLVIISAGRHNRYGHPHPETLATLAAANIPYRLTAQRGMIKIETDFFGTKLVDFAQQTGTSSFLD